MMNISFRCRVLSVAFVLSVFCIRPPMALPGGRIAGEPGPPAKHAAVVKLPIGYRVSPPRNEHFTGSDVSIDLWASRFAQGAAVYAEIYPNNSGPETQCEVKRFSFDGREIEVSKRKWGCRALFGIHPETAAGKKQVRIVYESGGTERSEDFAIQVSASEFRFYERPLDLGKFSDVDYRLTPEEYAFIEACAGKKKKAFAQRGPDRLGDSLSHPRNRHHVTSPFWAKRLVMQYRIKNGKKIMLKNKLNIHRGIDLRGKTGDPVFALADGEVVIAEQMYYEGNFIVIDHGSGIFSSYMHLDGLKVKEGDAVRGGSMIGKVGSTGQSTASHLHVSLLVQGVSVDPLSLLVLPLRN